jgi:C4-dicarboxylate-specific signal transduction histidine kinase
LTRALAVRDPDRKILKFVGISTDVHDLRQVQEELRNTQLEFARVTRILRMGELTTSIAHEVSQPLGPSSPALAPARVGWRRGRHK